MTYDDNKYGSWAGFDISEENQRPASRNLIHIEHQQLDTTIEKNAHLTGKASTTLPWVVPSKTTVSPHCQLTNLTRSIRAVKFE